MFLSKDTIENRFLKYAIFNISDRFKRVKRNVLRILKADNVDIKNKIEEMEEELSLIENDPFFRGIGTFKGFTQDSLVMKQAVGYRDVYEYWIILQCGYDLQEGIMQLEVKDISELYEIWCFIKVKNIVQHILRDKATVHTEGSKMDDDFVKTLIQGSKSEVTFYQIDKPQIQLASVMYNATTDDEEAGIDESVIGKNTDIEYTTSKTTEQRPDIVLRLSKTEDSFQYTYLFDAKYRIRDTTIPSRDGVDVPPVDAINQLHRYRDAIFYSKERDERLKREVIGGYVLYPGNLNRDQFKGSYYHRSVDEVNIGAFPLKPGGQWKSMFKKDGHYNELLVDPTSSEDVLYHQIEEWLNDDYPEDTLLQTAIPQKGLEYTEEPAIKGAYLLSIIDSHVNSDVKAIENGESVEFVTGYRAILAGLDFQKIKYFAPVVNHTVTGYYIVNSVNAVDMKSTLDKDYNDRVQNGKDVSKYKGFDKTIRIRLELGRYKKLEKPFTYGLDMNAAKGVTLTRTEFHNYIETKSIDITYEM